MKKIPTAEAFWILNSGQHQNTAKLMIEFAKIHVEQALKEASEKAHMQMDEHDLSCSVNKNSILNSYPLSNIK